MAPQRPTKPLEERCEKITSRFDKRYAQKLARLCEESDLKPANAVKFATMVFLDLGTLDLVAKIQRVEDKLDDFRSDFNEVVISDEE